MLTKNDLQQIREVVKDEIKAVKTKLNKVAKTLDIVVRRYDERITAVENDVKILKHN